MRVGLARPSYHTHLITPQLALGYLSSYLREAGYSTRIVDGLNEQLSPEEIVGRCADCELMGISALTDYFPEVITLSRALKAAGKTVVVGGPHATALPAATLKESGADYVVVGEGEETLCELAGALAAGGDPEKVAGVYGPRDRRAGCRDLIGDLNLLPFPDWERMDPRLYQKAPHGAFIKRFPVAPLMSTRGCPFECSFCASPFLWEKRIRFRSPENVVEEIEYLVREFGVREIHFEDDNLTLRRSHIEGICNLLLRRKLDISWAAPNGVRADTLDRGLVGLMKRSGCYMLAFGIESGNQEILDRVGKRTDLSTVRRAIAEAGRAGIVTQGFFIFGLPGETEETVKETLRFAKRSGLDRAQFLLLDVIPGSRLGEDLMVEGDPRSRGRSYQQVSWCPDTISRDFLQRAPGWAFRSFFFRPRQLYRLVRMIRPAQLKYLIRRIRDFNILSTGSFCYKNCRE